LYDELKARLGDFPLHHYWGPLAGIQSTTWIVDSAIVAAEKYRPNLFYLYLPHLDYAAQKNGPESKAARQALTELDAEIAKLIAGFEKGYGEPPLWIVASEYVIVPVNNVVYPNRMLREAGLLKVGEGEEGEFLDLNASKAWAMADHQCAHVYVHDPDPKTHKKVARLFAKTPGIAEVLTAEQLAEYRINHPRCGDIVLVSEPHSWQAYYYWLDDARAPKFARTVDIHRKPGYDPVELFLDGRTKSIPLNANLVRGSHGAPARDPHQRGVLLTSEPGVFLGGQLADVEVADIILKQFATD
jgi:predicted AlkP superfamily pyrophosphatase or phosphodiesterase